MASINQLFPELSEKEEQKSPISSKMSDECFEHSPNIKSEASGELSGNESGHHHQSGMDSSCDSGRVSTPASLEGDYPLSRDSKFHDLSRGEKKNNFRPWEDDSNKTNETEHRVPGMSQFIFFWIPVYGEFFRPSFVFLLCYRLRTNRNFLAFKKILFARNLLIGAQGYEFWHNVYRILE